MSETAGKRTRQTGAEMPRTHVIPGQEDLLAEIAVPETSTFGAPAPVFPGAVAAPPGSVLDLFAGPGGWSTAARALGLTEDGIELDDAAFQTRTAVGHRTPWRDVWAPANDLTIKLRHGMYEGLICSPPCQTFSLAGKGSGRKALDQVLAALASGRWADLADLRRLGEELGEEKTALVLTPLHYAHALMPKWVAWEQVPAVLPVWEACAEIMRGWGYHVWTGMVHAEQYGVPQTRKRAVLIASADHPVDQPKPTHSKFYSRTPGKLDEGVHKWVSMAEALGWGCRDLVGFPRLADEQARTTINGVDYRARDLREAAYPSFVVTEKARSWQRWAEKGWVLRNNSSENACSRSVDQPSGTLYFGARSNYCAWEWTGEGPAPAEHPCAPADKQFLCAAGAHSEGRPRPVAEPAPTITGKGTAAWLASEGEYRSAEHAAVISQGWDLVADGEGHHWEWRGEGESPAKAPGEWAIKALLAAAPDDAALAAVVASRLNDQTDTQVSLLWPAHRPATVLATRDLVQHPGATANRFNGSTKSRNDGVRVTVEEAAILQSFPADYAWQGNSSKKFQQIGNAVPPLMAEAILREAIYGH